MKRLFVFALLALVSITAWAGSETAPVPENVRYSLVVKQFDKLVSQADVVATPGTDVPLSVLAEHTYIKQACHREAAAQAVTLDKLTVATDAPKEAEDCADEKGATTGGTESSKTTLVPGTFNTGLSLTLNTYAQSDRVHVRLSLAQLVKMTTFKQDDLLIQLPEVKTNVIDQHMVLKPHQTVTLINNTDGLQVTLTRL